MPGLRSAIVSLFPVLDLVRQQGYPLARASQDLVAAVATVLEVLPLVTATALAANCPPQAFLITAGW